MSTNSGDKRKADDKDPDFDSLRVTPLGAGKEVGRSCILLEYKGKKIMLDCGIHPGIEGRGSLPFWDGMERELDPSTIDLLLVTHFHLDHCAALPFYLRKTNFKGRVFMTHPTKSIYKLILQDFLKVSSIAVDDQLYNEQDVLKSMDQIEGINYHQDIHHKGIKICAYNAGHVLGAAMFMIEIAGVKILYTGDYSRSEDRHLMAAEIPDQKPDVLIIESTYGVQTHPPIRERERRFTDVVHSTVQRGGRCLIPVFALGRAQELLLILDEHWKNHPELQNIPIYFASSLGSKCKKAYKTYINMMNERIRSQRENPFLYRYVTDLSSMDQYEDSTCVVMASPGMLQNGLSREFFEMWCGDKRNSCVVPGYCVSGTLAKEITEMQVTQITAMNGQKLPLNCAVSYISFSAHADYDETSKFIEELRPTLQHVILVHGSSDNMGRLRQKLIQRYTRQDGSLMMSVSAPDNCMTVEMEFHPETQAKTVGSLAVAGASEGRRVKGLLVRKDFVHSLLSVDDLADYTPMVAAQLVQRLTVPFHQSYETLRHFLSQMFVLDSRASMPVPISILNMVNGVGGGAPVTAEGESAAPSERMQSVPCVSLGSGMISVLLVGRDRVMVEWNASPVNDMTADAVVALILSIEANPHNLKVLHKSCSHGHHHHHNSSCSVKTEPVESSSTVDSATLAAEPVKPIDSSADVIKQRDERWLCAIDMLKALLGDRCVHVDRRRRLIFCALSESAVPPPFFKQPASRADTEAGSDALAVTALVDHKLNVHSDNADFRVRLQRHLDHCLIALFPLPLDSLAAPVGDAISTEPTSSAPSSATIEVMDN